MLRHAERAEYDDGDGLLSKEGEARAQRLADSRSDLSSIRQANQGVFVILPRDPAPGVNEGAQLQKMIRVVSTVQYFLQ
jgi:hypothetical protein